MATEIVNKTGLAVTAGGDPENFACLNVLIELDGISASAWDVSESVSCSVMSNSATPWTAAARLLCPWDSPGKMVSHSLLQGIFLVQGWNQDLLHFGWILYRLSPDVSGGRQKRSQGSNKQALDKEELEPQKKWSIAADAHLTSRIPNTKNSMCVQRWPRDSTDDSAKLHLSCHYAVGSDILN